MKPIIAELPKCIPAPARSSVVPFGGEWQIITSGLSAANAFKRCWNSISEYSPGVWNGVGAEHPSPAT